MRALIVGGTGPSGPAIVTGLHNRDYEVTIYHRGTHETDDLPAVAHHLHGDPFSREQLEADFGSSKFDVVISMYGRLRFVADLMAGRCDRFIAIGGKGGNVPPEQLPFPEGRALPIDESHPRYQSTEQSRVGWAVAQSERDVFAHHDAQHFRATVLRYTDLYGPRVPRQWMWPIVRRVLDGRHQIVVPGDGSQLRTACYVENAAEQVVLAVDHPEASGEAFHCVDTTGYPLRDVIRLVANELGHELEIVTIAHRLATTLATGYAPPTQQFDATKLRTLLGYADRVPPAEALRQTARWLVEHRDEIDEEQLATLVPNPYAYEVEDQLIASHQRWSEEVGSTLQEPDIHSALGPGFRDTQ
jgi:nucleoside-diphosphate-sugar epimerase